MAARLLRATADIPLIACYRTQNNSDGPDDTKPKEFERDHCQLHVGNDDPPAVFLVELIEPRISRRERRQCRDREAQAVDAEEDKREIKRGIL
jgi:hypothetical protein